MVSSDLPISEVALIPTLPLPRVFPLHTGFPRASVLDINTQGVITCKMMIS